MVQSFDQRVRSAELCKVLIECRGTEVCDFQREMFPR